MSNTLIHLYMFQLPSCHHHEDSPSQEVNYSPLMPCVHTLLSYVKQNKKIQHKIEQNNNVYHSYGCISVPQALECGYAETVLLLAHPCYLHLLLYQ